MRGPYRRLETGEIGLNSCGTTRLCPVGVVQVGLQMNRDVPWCAKECDTGWRARKERCSLRTMSRLPFAALVIALIGCDAKSTKSAPPPPVELDPGCKTYV